MCGSLSKLNASRRLLELSLMLLFMYDMIAIVYCIYFFLIFVQVQNKNYSGKEFEIDNICTFFFAELGVCGSQLDVEGVEDPETLETRATKRAKQIS